MYLDKLDGRIGAAFFDRKAGEWRREQDAILRNIQIHQDTDQNHIEDVWGFRNYIRRQLAPGNTR
jgi:hypothetical protein